MALCLLQLLREKQKKSINWKKCLPCPGTSARLLTPWDALGIPAHFSSRRTGRVSHTIQSAPLLPSLLFSPRLSWICRSVMSKCYSSTMFPDVLLRKATVFRAPGPQWSGNAAANRVTSQLPHRSALGFPRGLAVKNPPQEMQVWFLGQEALLEEGMATHSSIPPWRIPWTEEPGGQIVGHDWNSLAHTGAEPGGRVSQSPRPLHLCLSLILPVGKRETVALLFRMWPGSFDY